LIRQLEVQNVTLWATIFTEFLPIYRKNASAFTEKIFFVKPLTDGGPNHDEMIKKFKDWEY